MQSGSWKTKLGHRITHHGLHFMATTSHHLPHRPVSAVPGQCPQSGHVPALTGCREECRGSSESWEDASGHFRSATVCLGQANLVEVAGELRQRQVGGNVWWAPHRDGSPENAGGLAAREWLGACTGASRDYDVRDSRQPTSPAQGELAISLRCTSCNTVQTRGCQGHRRVPRWGSNHWGR